jgi:hypothetical protein
VTEEHVIGCFWDGEVTEPYTSYTYRYLDDDVVDANGANPAECTITNFPLEGDMNFVVGDNKALFGQGYCEVDDSSDDDDDDDDDE